jgi:hypothetical protein
MYVSAYIYFTAPQDDYKGSEELRGRDSDGRYYHQMDED